MMKVWAQVDISAADRERLRRRRLPQVIDEPGHRAAGVGETGEQHHERQAVGHRGGVRDAFVDLSGEGHVSMLRAAPGAGL